MRQSRICQETLPSWIQMLQGSHQVLLLRIIYDSPKEANVSPSLQPTQESKLIPAFNKRVNLLSTRRIPLHLGSCTCSSMYTIGPARIGRRQVQRNVAVFIKVSWFGSLAKQLWSTGTAFWCIELHLAGRLLSWRKMHEEDELRAEA